MRIVTLLLFSLCLCCLCNLCHLCSLCPEAWAQSETSSETASEDGRMTLLTPVNVDLGRPFLVRLTSLDPLEEVAVHWLGRQVVPAVSVWNEKHIVLAMLGTDVQVTAPGPSELVVVCTTPQGHTQFSRTITVNAVIFPEDPDSDAQPLTPAEQERVAREAREAATAMHADTPQRRWFLPFDRPVEGEITGPYGNERLAWGRQTFRRGLDLAVEYGTPVHACGTGTVVLLADHLLAGKSIYIDHGNGVVSMYFHLLRSSVTVGQSVTRGDVIGMAGATGRDMARQGQAKLHFGVAVQGRLVNPAVLFESSAEDLLPQ